MAGDRRQKLLSLSGVLPLGVYLALHLYETAPRSREGFVSALSGGSGEMLPVILETALVLLPLAVHAALGLATLRDGTAVSKGGYPSTGARLLARASGVGILLFLLVHLAHTWAAKLGGLPAAGLYDVLRDDLGKPLYLGAYAFGLTCVAFHFGLGVGALPETWGIARTHAARRAARIGGGVLGALVWLVSIDTLSHFATGRALVGGGTP